MKALILAGCLTALTLSGCQKKEELPATEAIFKSLGQRGRYVAVGIYAPGLLWEQLSPRNKPGAAETSAIDAASANLTDDQQILVVMDSATGELRQCGNLSGHCIGFNPWAKSLEAGQSAPVQLLKHAQQLQEESEAAAKAETAEFERKARPR